MISIRAARAAAIVTLPMLMASGCGHSGSTGTQSVPAAAGTTVTTPTEQAQPQLGRRFTANPAIVGSRPLAFDSWSRIDDHRIAVNFQIGSPDCFGVDETTTETTGAVTIALRAGTLPEAVGRMCAMIEVFGTLEVQLAQPLGNRKVNSST
ncbi:hypothetical protein [Nocardia sp. alder85J]|uniref:hypothetical protein n=1 Tax=Nocardia sp. alder85J TaxID=2862949 RepID=UPI001CD67D2D|nr:hypothetical protein [Nocardia sp. alder85J]MCX4097071.1 hypothetical protein [Nocardia sp. alder85J]